MYSNEAEATSMSRLLLIAVLLVPLTGLAEIYRSTDAEGNVVFTDTPPPNGSETNRVELKRINTVEPPPAITPPPGTEATDPAAETAVAAYTVKITSPAPETSFPMGPGNFSVSVQVDPPLKKYEGLQLFMDGAPWGAPQRDNMWDLTNVFRGQHDLTVGVIDNAGKTLVMSEPVRVYVHRPSINFNKPPPKPKPPKPTPK
jgi:hypothetical protein